MESILKSQLKQLKSVQRNEPVLPKNAEATFLFDFHNARRVDVDTIFSLGYSGLIDLAKHNPKFAKYFKDLFSNTSKYFNRETKREEELKETDQAINDLLIDLGPFFRHKATHMVLEFLIKIYNVHVYNAKGLFLAFLPYHESKYFIKLIQNINFEQFNHLKNFFCPYVKNGLVILKESIYKELSGNMNLLREVLNYYENIVKFSDVDDSEYFNFISGVFTLIIKTSSKGLDTNLINLILQFLTKSFKSFTEKYSLLEEDYEEKIIPKLSELIIVSVQKISLNQDYIKAILNDLVNKVLVNCTLGDSTNLLIKTITFLCEELEAKNQKNLTLPSNILYRETLDNLSNKLDDINSFFEDQDLYSLIISILHSNISGNFDIDLIKKIFKENFDKISVLTMQKFIHYLFDLTCKDSENTANTFSHNLKSDILNLLSFLEETQPNHMNSVLIKIFSNPTDKKYLEKVKELTKLMSEQYKMAVESNDKEINAFNLFVNLNSTNISNVLNSLKKLDELCSLNDENTNSIVSYCVPSVSNKFSFLDQQIILEEIINMKNFKFLLEKYPAFRNEFLGLFYKIYEDGVKIYSEEFLSKLQELVISNLVSEDSENSIKILIYILLNNEEKKNYITSLFEKNSFLSKTFLKVSNLLEENFVNFLCAHSNQKINAVKFFKCLYEILLVKPNIKFNYNKLNFYIKKILSKDIEKLNFLKTITLEELQTLVNILEISGLNSDLYENISSTLIENIPTEISDEILQILFKLSYSLISNNNLPHLDKLIKHCFKNNSHQQVFISQLILRKNITNNNFYSYIKDILTENTFEFSLLSSLIYSLTIDQVDSKKILDIIEFGKKLKIGKTNFNIENLKSSPTKLNFNIKENISNNKLDSLREEIIKRKNEISLNKNYLEKFISSKCDSDIFYSLNEVFINNFPSSGLYNEELSSRFKIFNLFMSGNISTNKVNNKKLLSEFMAFYKGLINSNSGKNCNNSLLSNKIFVQLLEKLLTNIINIFSTSSIEVLKLLLDLNTPTTFEQNFIHYIFSRENFSIDTENTNKNLELSFKIIKFGLKYQVSSDSFISNDQEFAKNILKFIHDTKLAHKEDEQFIIFFLFEIIFKNNNSNFTFDFALLTLEILSSIKSELLVSTHSIYLNISNNLLTIVSNCTIESEEKNKLHKGIEEIESNIFYLITKFRDSQLDSSNSLELVHIVNTLFLCLNKLISQFTKVDEEREIVKKLISKSFEILNKEEQSASIETISYSLKDEVYLIFINAIKNFIESLFQSHNNVTLTNYEIFFEYIHYFVKFTLSLTMTNFKLKEGKIIENILSSFVNNKIILQNEKLLACFFVNLFYYNFSNNYNVNEKMMKTDNDFYSSIIFNFFNQEDDAKFTKLSLDLILSILEQMTSTPNKIFYVQEIKGTNQFDPYFLSLNLINKILQLVENNFFGLNTLTENVNKTLLNILLGLNSCRKYINGKIKTKEESGEGSNLNWNFYLKEIKTFEDRLFNDMYEARILHKTIIEIYSQNNTKNTASVSIDKNTRNYLLNKYLEILITNKPGEKQTQSSQQDEQIQNVFDFFITHTIIDNKEDKTENLQIIFSILTRILNDNINNQPMLNNFLKVLKNKKNMENLLSLLANINEEKESSNINTVYYNYSIFVFLSKVFLIYQAKFLDKFNDFLSIIVNVLKVSIHFKNEDLTLLTLETFKPVSMKLSEYFSPQLNQIVFNLLVIILNYSKIEENSGTKNSSIEISLQITSLANSILENISKKQLLENTFNTAKFCVKNLFKISEFVEGNKLSSPLKSLMNFLKISFNISDKLMITGLFDKILKFFIKLLLNQQAPSESILECFKAFILKINEKQLKSLFADIIKFGKEQGDFENDFKYKLNYTIVAFELLNTILKTISVIFTPYFEKYKSFWTDLIMYTNAVFSAEDKRHQGKKKGRTTFDSAYEDEENKFSYLYLNSLLLENVAMNFKYNTENQILNETIEDLIEPLVGQLKFIFFENQEEKIMKYFDEKIRGTFVEIFKSLKSEDLFKELNDMVSNFIF
jgi:hypothetical protein